MTTIKVKQINLCERCLKNRATINYEYFRLGLFLPIVKTRLICSDCFKDLRLYRRLNDYNFV